MTDTAKIVIAGLALIGAIAIMWKERRKERVTQRLLGNYYYCYARVRNMTETSEVSIRSVQKTLVDVDKRITHWYGCLGRLENKLDELENKLDELVTERVSKKTAALEKTVREAIQSGRSSIEALNQRVYELENKKWK